MSRPQDWTVRLCMGFVLLSALAASSCSSPGDANLPIVGEWKWFTDSELNRASLKFFPNGSCRLTEENRKLLFCSWSSRAGGEAFLRYGSLLPINTAVGTVEGDTLWLDHGTGARSAWIRAGSQQERTTTAYFRGQTLIESGDYEKGMAQLTWAADRGHNGAQNSLSWLLATNKDPSLHDGKRAVVYAEKATAALRHYQYLDTLAAALARDGQFERAVKIEEEALSLLEKDMDRLASEREAAEERFRHRIQLYKSGQAYTEP